MPPSGGTPSRTLTALFEEIYSSKSSSTGGIPKKLPGRFKGENGEMVKTLRKKKSNGKHDLPAPTVLSK